MNAFPRNLSLLRLPLNLLTLAAALLAPWQTALAQGTHLWTQSRIEDFEKGTPQGVALTSDGHLREGPALTQILTTPSTFVWSVAMDKSGTAYLGTASPATVLRVGADGKPFTLFETKDLSVQVVRLGPDGALYAATMPSGKVFRLDANANGKLDDSSATVVFDASTLSAPATSGKPAAKREARTADDKSDEKKEETKPDSVSHYIWDMTFDAAGKLYIAAGGPAAVYRVDPAHPQAVPETFFHCDEQHIRSLAWDAHGNLIAGSDGSGLIYRIDHAGKGYVLFEAPRREITAVAVGADGTIYAASVGDKSRNPLPPLPVQGVGSITITIVQPGSLQAANASAALPEGTEIYALCDGQAPRKLWAGKDEIVYALAARPDGLLALSGNRGRVFSIAADGTYADVAHLDAQQALSLASDPSAAGGVLIGAGNTGQLYRFGASASRSTHEYASDVLDAGSLARFGRIEVEPGSQGYEFFTRSGNVEQPVRGRNDWGWSDWQPLKDGQIGSPAGRFLEWKAVLNHGGSVGGVGVNYLPVNAAPVVDELVVVPGARFNGPTQAAIAPTTINIALPSSGQGASIAYDASAAPLPAMKDRTAIAVRWAAHDDNGDDMIYSLYLRGDGESVWRLLKDNLTDKSYTFDATLIPDGGYQIKVVASDAPSHSTGDVLMGDKISERFEVDTTPPVITALKALRTQALNCNAGPCPQPFKVTFDAEDAFSPIVHAEYSLDAGPWQYLEPVGGLADTRREHFEFNIEVNAPAGKFAEHLIAVRAYDRHDNVGVGKTVIPADTVEQKH